MGRTQRNQRSSGLPLHERRQLHHVSGHLHRWRLVQQRVDVTRCYRGRLTLLAWFQAGGYLFASSEFLLPATWANRGNPLFHIFDVGGYKRQEHDSLAASDAGYMAGEALDVHRRAYEAMLHSATSRDLLHSRNACMAFVGQYNRQVLSSAWLSPIVLRVLGSRNLQSGKRVVTCHRDRHLKKR